MGLTIAILVLGFLGLALFIIGVRRIWRLKMLSGGLQGVSGALLITLALLLGSIASNLHTYQRLSHETGIATIRFDQLGPQRFRAVLARNAETAELFEIHGDEWQLDARVLKWTGLANILGMDSGYQLERLSGRYRQVEQAKTAQHSIHALYQPQGIDLWHLARQYPDWVPWVDAVYGSATYMPMVHGAKYQISISQSGLITRPLNDIAKQAIQNWQ